MAKKPALGRGLEHLLNQNINIEETTTDNNIQTIKIKELKPNPYQPRKKFDDSALEELANSIKEQGVFQPILVRKAIVGYEIIAGERRFRASKLAGLKEIPAVIYDYSDQKMMEVALIENIQREDLTIVEEAKSYKMIIENLGFTQEELGKKVGKSRPHISNTLRILALDDEILDLIDDKTLTMGHVKVLVTIKDKSRVTQIVNSILRDGLSVRQTEEIAKVEKSEKLPKIPKEVSKAVPRNKRLENQIREKLDTKVKISGEEKGTIEITYNSEDDLGRILEHLNLI
jgi:ParB family chromosome partitioning protein